MDALENFYNDISIDGKLYKLPWKALAAGIPEPVEMHVRRGADSLDYSKLKVRILGGSTLTPTTGANTPLQTFNLTGTTPGDEYAVVAQYEKDKENAYAGGLWAATYQNKTFTLYVVPLPGVDFTQSVHGNLQNYLNRIYSQAVVSWNVQVIKGFTGIDLGENGLDHAENELLSAYNPEMNSVISAFKAWQGSINSQAAYLFLVPRADGGLQGYMPFNRQFGFVVAPTGSDGNVDAAALARTVAHELGHGIFSLRHTFSEKNFVTLPQGKTDNLMDYPSTGSGLATATDATKLDKYQWDLIHDPQRVWFSWLEEEGEGEIGIYGVTWLGNVLFGLYPDEQEREIETRLELFNHIYQEYENYYNNSKIKDIYLSVDKYKNWSVRKASFQGIAKKVFKGLKTNDNTFNLWNEGIYFEDYKLEGKSYKIAIYSARKNIVLGETIRIKSFSQLRYNKSIKAGYTKNYGLISFYDTEGKMNMVIQIIGESSKKDVTQWLNYLGLILPSREQEKEDKDIIDKILEVILHDINKLNEIWGEKKEDQEESAIEIALTEMEEFLGNSYAYGGGDSRTSLDEKGTDEMDCSEFVARFLQKACGLEEVPSPFYTSLMLSSMQDGSFDSFLQHVKNSEKEDFKDIRPGDVFLWSRSSSDGHTGVVVSYDKETDKVTVIEAIGISGAAEESLSKDIEGYCQGCIRKSIYTRTGKALYKHAGWKGYFRAVTTK
ncbi:hypothetical protein [Tenuifilum osseticum]|uniref:hypothetical protein n=2 Tax=Tenuifilum TaxID=2760873 RepID=UPI0034E4914A